MVDSRKIARTRVHTRNSESIFNAENDAVDRFFASRTHSRVLNDQKSQISKWNTDFNSCYDMLPYGNMIHSMLKAMT